MIKTLISEFPVSDLPKERSVSKEKIKKYTYSKAEVDVLIDAAVERAVAEARKIDEESMAKHNRDATVLSMILGFTTLALFVDRVESDVIDKIRQVPIQKLFHR